MKMNLYKLLKFKNYLAYSTGAGVGTSLNGVKGRNPGGFSSPVQQPQDERATPPAMVDNMTKRRNNFIILVSGMNM